MFLRFATAPPPQARDRISPFLRDLRDIPNHALRIRSQTQASEEPHAENTATLPTTTILSLGLGFIGAALVAIVLTLFLRYYLVTRVYPDRRPPPREGGFWARFGGWWDTFLAGYGSAYWEPRYVVRRRPRRPEMWEVILDEKAAARGRDSRMSGSTEGEVEEKEKEREKEKEKERQQEEMKGKEKGKGKAKADEVKTVDFAGGSRDPVPRGPGVRLVRVSEEEEELGELTQPLALSPTGPALTRVGSAQSAASRASEGSIAISVLLLMPAESADPDDIPPLALGTAYLAPESPLPDLGHVRSRTLGEEEDKDELVLDIVHTQPRYPPTFADLAMVRF